MKLVYATNHHFHSNLLLQNRRYSGHVTNSSGYCELWTDVNSVQTQICIKSSNFLFLFLAHLIHHQMCYCYQKLEIWKISGADREQIPMWCVLANQRLRIERGWGVDREQIRSGSPPKIMWSLWANQRLIKSEWIPSQSVPITPNPLLIQFLEDLLPKVMWSLEANQMCPKSLTSCYNLSPLLTRCVLYT